MLNARVSLEFENIQKMLDKPIMTINKNNNTNNKFPQITIITIIKK